MHVDRFQSAPQWHWHRPSETVSKQSSLDISSSISELCTRPEYGGLHLKSCPLALSYRHGRKICFCVADVMFDQIFDYV